MIYFVRHGSTYDNENNNILSGHNSVELSKKGIEQAKETATKLKDTQFDICFCSPLKRTQQTLKYILKYHKNLPVVFDDRLKERDYGEITNMPSSVCKFERWNANEKIPFKMESIPEMFDRIASFYDEILNKYKGKNILIVSHSGVARLSYFYFNGKPKDGDYTNFKLNNADVMQLEN